MTDYNIEVNEQVVEHARRFAAFLQKSETYREKLENLFAQNGKVCYRLEVNIRDLEQSTAGIIAYAGRAIDCIGRF